MAKKTRYDLDKFRKLVQSGKAKSDIMKAMKIKGYPQFSTLELRLFKADKKVYEIPSGSTKSDDVSISIGKRGNITIPTKVIENTKFKEGDKFNFNVRADKIILTLYKD